MRPLALAVLTLLAAATPASALTIRHYTVQETEFGYVRSAVTVCTARTAAVTLIADFRSHGTRPVLRTDDSRQHQRHGCHRHVLNTRKTSTGLFSGTWDTQLTVSTLSATRRSSIRTIVLG